MRFLKFRISQRHQKPLCEDHISILTSLLCMTFQQSLWSVFKKTYNSKGVNNPGEINYRSMYKVAQMFKYFMDQRFILLYKHRKKQDFLETRMDVKDFFIYFTRILICYSRKVGETPSWIWKVPIMQSYHKYETWCRIHERSAEVQPQGFFHHSQYIFLNAKARQQRKYFFIPSQIYLLKFLNLFFE